MEIKQIVEARDLVFGLGVDNKMYKWDFNQGMWVPFWNPNQKSESEIPV